MTKLQQKELHSLTSGPPFSFRACDTRLSPSAVALALAIMASASPEKERC